MSAPKTISADDLEDAIEKYEKVRPRTLEEIIGQLHTVDIESIVMTSLISAVLNMNDDKMRKCLSQQ